MVRYRGPALLIGSLGALLVLLCLLSLALGALSIPLDQVVQTLTGHDVDRTTGNVIWSVRAPRTALGLAAGAALGVSGALMQALTRNPLADPGLLGVSAGAAFAIVAAMALLGVTSLFGFIWFALAGALLTSLVVYALARLGRSGLTPVKLALAGIAVTSLLFSVTNAIILIDPESLNRYRFWSAGSLAGQTGEVVLQILPFVAAGTLIALACAPALNSLALGDDVATSLGRRPALVRAAGVIAIMLLTGAAVAVIGPVVFLGLVVPHVARVLAVRAGVGPDHRWLLPISALLAPILLLTADLAGRLAARPAEIQAGVLIAFIGGPFFIALVRRRRLAEL
ncbi:FecCD family ABC transporter permease [Acrocarpospora catenulata]|uniref:FecCD family ABC transporter permease n=1 Tax=Acrocarpospora catenulata TaxID=2836182 RepID=UPI001BDB3581|nr:iron chelate uptake ABC transporter family permease subunit [Acrocarpospora catenulata]